MIIEPKTLNPLEIYKLYVQLQVLLAKEGLIKFLSQPTLANESKLN